mgnify:CR=1 FL=1
MNDNTKKLFSVFRKRHVNINKTKLLSNDNIGNIKITKQSEIELIKLNAEIERKKLAKELGISLNSSWKEIVKKIAK